MNLTGQKVRQKATKFPEDKPRLGRVKGMGCIICEEFGEPQMSPTDAHHPICDRYSQVRTPDAFATPFCDGHHQQKWDATKTAIHSQRAEFVEKYGPDHAYINIVRRKLGEPDIEDDVLAEWF